MKNRIHAPSTRNRRRERAVFLFVASSALLGACVEPLELDAIGEDEADLCGDPAAFQEALSRCGTDCAGIASVNGSLLSMDLHINDESLHDASVKVVRFFDDGEQIGEVVDSIDFNLHGAYGDFLFEFKDLDALPVSGEGSNMTPGPRGDGMARTTDGFLRTSIRISNGTESDNVAAVQGTGFLRIEEISTSRVKGSFDIQYGSEADRLLGCFDIFPSAVSHEREDVEDE